MKKKVSGDKEVYMLSLEEEKYYDTFGFLHMKSIFSIKEMNEISNEFEELMNYDLNYSKFQGKSRQQVYGFVELSDKLTSLLIDKRIYEPIHQLLGENFIWLGSDGNRYVENTGWHPDGSNLHYKRIKIIFYLDALSKENGALRVIPGSHLEEFHNKLSPLIQRKNNIKTPYGVKAPKRDNNIDSGFGVYAWEIPSVVLSVKPGDIILFNQNLWHSSFFGDIGRRMFTISFGEYPKNNEDIQFIKSVYKGQLSHIQERQIRKRNYVYGKLFINNNSKINKMTELLKKLNFT